MNRRAYVAVAAIAGMLLGGCASGARGSSSEGVARELLEVTPAAAGELDVLRWNSTFGEPASLDPIKAFNYPENTVVANLCEGLFQIQPDFSVQPHLASSVEAVGDRTYVLQIREDVTFWDGSPMTVDDVIFSLDRHRDPAEGSYWASETTANIAGIERTGDWEVTVRLTEPDTTFVEQLATNVGFVVSRAHREQAGSDYGNPDAGVMCTGPFSVAAWKQGQAIQLERFDGYWREDRRAHAQRVELSFVLDPTAIANGLETGELQGSYDVPLSALSQLGQSEAGELFSGRGMQLFAIAGTGEGAFADPAVRTALTRATDRAAIAELVFEGTATAATSLVPADVWAAIPGVAEERAAQLPDFSLDLAAAKEALAEADVDITQPIRIAYGSERTHYADVLNEVSRAAAEIGLTVEPVGVPSAQFGAFFSDPAARAGYDGFVTTNYLSGPDPLPFLRSIAHTAGDQNFSGFSDPEIDAALQYAAAIEDPEERARATVVAEALILDAQPWVPIADLSVRLFMNREVTGAPASFVYLYYPWAADIGSAE